MPLPEPKPPKGYRPQSADTDEAAERYLFERLRDLPPGRWPDRASATPPRPAAELRNRFAALVLGREASIELFGWDPHREGW
jgi:hypothetical protein